MIPPSRHNRAPQAVKTGRHDGKISPPTLESIEKKAIREADAAAREVLHDRGERPAGPEKARGVVTFAN